MGPRFKQLFTSFYLHHLSLSFPSIPSFLPLSALRRFTLSVYCLIILSPTIWQTKREDRAKMNRLTKREEACNMEKHSSFLLFVQKDGGKHEEVKKKVKAIDFLFFIVLLDLCHTSGSSKMRRSHLILIFPLLLPWPQFIVLTCFSSCSPLSSVSIPLPCQISILICLHCPPLLSPTAPPPSIYFFLSDSSAGWGVGHLKGGVVAIS